MDKLDTIERELLTYFRKCLKDKSPCYFKSKHIAQDLGELTPKEVGTRLMQMSEKNLGNIRIIKYAFSVSTTWRVEKYNRRRSVV
jgi:hypothetical protein